MFGSKSRNPSSWIDTKRDVHDFEKKRIVGAVLEILVNVVMSTHVYVFCGRYFLQKSGGPIGLRSTATIAALIMKLWDMSWLKLAKRERLSIVCFFRYVDDCRNMLHAIMEGWRWVDSQFKFSKEWETEDIESGLSDFHRTMREVTKAMSSLISFIQFEGEEQGMFPGNKLPTLDTAIWWENGKLFYEFYEKPTVPNRVLQKDTALAESTVRSSLNQEVVRRLLNCSIDLGVEKKQGFLSTFSQKLINSGFSSSSAQVILVHGVARYVEILNRSKLCKSNPRYRP